MRSKSFAEFIEKRGIPAVFVIEGGYRAFRRFAIESFSSAEKLLILGGYTGSGKTKILQILKERGQQVIDLEGIANHKGSAFGAIGQPGQPQNEHFGNLLFWEWKDLDHHRPIWLEDESIHIGRVFIPEILFNKMRISDVIFINIPKDIRAELLVKEYVGSDNSLLIESINKISKRLGGLYTRNAIEAIKQNNYHTAALIALKYYDKFYLKGLLRRDTHRVKIIDSETTDPALNSEKIMNIIFKHGL